MTTAAQTSHVHQEPGIHHEDLDVLIIGAGLSGVGMAYQLKTKRPGDSFAVIEARKDIGGTWDLFRYPGIRSDSDMYTFAYSFKPWKHKEFIGSGEKIRAYIREMVDENGLDRHIRFQERMLSANWCSATSRWQVTVARSDDQQYIIHARFLVTCTGYYNYDHGYLPKFAGVDDFQGTLAFPQHWPASLDYSDKTVLVIGSGATAVTLVPAMAKTAKKVTMLQRSPTYIVSVPSNDPLFGWLSRVLPSRMTNQLMRAKYILMQQLIYVLSRKFPALVRKLIRSQNEQLLAGSSDVDTHFNPRYAPWDQRMCMVPDEDLFAAIRSGKAEVTTDEIDHFTERGVRLKSGQELNADIIVPATGLEIQFWGGADMRIDGQPINPATLTNYKGMMFSQVPNMVTIFGYTNAPWTLKAELTQDYVVRLLDHMANAQHKVVFPHYTETEAREALVDLQAGYILRAQDQMPKQGKRFPWRNKDLYFKDLFAIKNSTLDDGVLLFDDTAPLAAFHSTAHKTRTGEVTSPDHPTATTSNSQHAPARESETPLVTP